MIILGEDYGEGASVIQERSYAYAMKSSMWLLDPRPDLPTIVRCVEQGFELSEATHAPVMLELRIRACHVTGEFIARDNRPGRYSALNRLPGPPRFDYARLSHPPVTFIHERLKVEDRMPAAQAFIRERKLNELIPGDLDEIGVVIMGGSPTPCCARSSGWVSPTSSAPLGCRFCPQRGLSAGAGGAPRLLRRQARRAGGRGRPTRIHRARAQRGTCAAPICKPGCSARVRCPRPANIPPRFLLNGLAAFLAEVRPAGLDPELIVARMRDIVGHRPKVAASLGEIAGTATGVLHRLSGAAGVQRHQAGCSARSVPTHISADIGCHSFGTLPPFSLGNSILGYGMSLASAAAVGPNMDRRSIAVMGDGGFWHNGLITGVASNLFNQGDGILIVMQNGYTSANRPAIYALQHGGARRRGARMDVETTLRSMGVKWLRKVRTYSVATMMATLKEAMLTAEHGLKVIIADGECQLARQRRVRAADAERLKRGERRGAHAFTASTKRSAPVTIRASGCPAARR